MSTYARISLAVLTGTAVVLGSGVADAQTVPLDQTYVVASEVQSDGKALHTQLWIKLLPTALGCSGNQTFFLHGALVEMHGAGGVQAWNLQVQVPQQGPNTSTSFILPGVSTGVGAAPTYIPAQLFTVGPVGVPVTALVINKPNFAAAVSVMVFGYCGTATNMGSVPVANL